MLRVLRRCWLPCVLLVAACGGAQVSDKWSPQRPSLSDTERHVQALRTAALARLQVRSGQDALAAESYRAAYALSPAVDHLVGYAQAAERAGWLGEGLEAMQRLLRHDLAVDQRAVVEAQVKRLAPLVPATWQRVVVEVAPNGARVELRGEHGSRLLLGTGAVWLAPGSWQMESSAKGYASELRTLLVGPGEAEVATVVLAAEEPSAGEAGIDGQRVVGQAASGQAAPTTEFKPASVSKPGLDAASVAPPAATEAPGKLASAFDKAGQPQSAGEAAERAPGVAEGSVLTTSSVEAPVAAVEAGSAVQGTPWLHKIGPWTTLGVGAVALAAGGWFSWQMTTAAQEANDALPTSTNAKTWYATQQDAIARATDHSRSAQFAWVAGGVLTSAGVLWAVLAPRWLRRHMTHAERPRLQPQIGLGSAALAWTF